MGSEDKYLPDLPRILQDPPRFRRCKWYVLQPADPAAGDMATPFLSPQSPLKFGKKLFKLIDLFSGTAVESYEVKEKKQVAEFDSQQWLAENPEEQEPETPCPVCNLSDREDVLLLCDGCEAAYHTYCIGLDHIPDGNWYCMECAHHLNQDTSREEPDDRTHGQQAEAPRPPPRPRRPRVPFTSRQSQFAIPRTRARLRRARRQARSLEWAGPWGRFAGRVYDALQIDLDNHEGDDDALQEFRRSQQRQAQEQREFERWQQRLHNERLGARDVFSGSIPRGALRQLQREQTSHLPQSQPVQESRDEILSWGALDRARRAEDSQSPGSRKRRNPTASPTESNREPERKLKRPCTRRFLPAHNEASSSSSAPVPVAAPPTITASNQPVENGASNGATNGATNGTTNGTANGTTHGTTHGTTNGGLSRSPPLPEAPSFLSALLREVEMNTPSDDENVKGIFARQGGDAMSPVTSPSLSAQSPRALSLTPPPLINSRPSSPPLSSYIEPRYPPANYSPTRAPEPDHTRAEKNGPQPLEIRHPRPRRPQQIVPPQRSAETSPARQALSPEAKASINGIVRSALKPHWHAKELTTEQYSAINRDVSRKLYEEIRDPSSLDDKAMKSWEKIATQEVARAVAETNA